MKILLLFIIFILCSIKSVFADSGNGYREYYQARHRAELSIIDYNIKKALYLYDSLFSSYTQVFTNDLYNASVCAIYEKDINRLIAYTKRIVKQSNEHIISTYENIPGFNEIMKSKEWKHFIEKEKREIENSFCLDQDSSILLALQEIFNEEQNRKKSNGEEVSIKELYEMFFESTKKFLLLFEDKGYDVMNWYYNKNFQHKFQTMLLHYYSLRQAYLTEECSHLVLDNVLLLDSILIRCVEQGYFDPYDYMTCSDVFSITMPYVVNFTVNIDSSYVTTWIPDDSLCRQENIKRDILGIPSIQEDAKKIRERIVFKTENYPFQAIKDTASALKILLNKGEIDSNDIVVYYTLGILDLEKKYTAELESQMLPGIKKVIVREGKDIELINNNKSLFFFRFPKSGWKIWYVGKEY